MVERRATAIRALVNYEKVFSRFDSVLADEVQGAQLVYAFAPANVVEVSLRRRASITAIEW